MRQTNDHTNPDLLQSIVDGDEPAFRVLFDQYHARVFDYLVTITKSREAAEELVMDIFLKLWLGREWIASIENIEAFLRKVAYNKAMDFLRHTARNKKMQTAIAVEMAKLQSRTPEDVSVVRDSSGQCVFSWKDNSGTGTAREGDK